MKNKKRIVIISILIITIMFCTDFLCTKLEKKPIFCIKAGSYSDGGSTQYIGLGYQVIVFNKIDSYGEDMFTAKYYYIGPISSLNYAWKKVENKAIQKHIDNM